MLHPRNPRGRGFPGGAFHVSTANHLRFSDGTVFTARKGADSKLTIAAPQSFGFLGSTGAIAFEGVQADMPNAFLTTYFDATAFEIRVTDWVRTRCEATLWRRVRDNEPARCGEG